MHEYHRNVWMKIDLLNIQYEFMIWKIIIAVPIRREALFNEKTIDSFTICLLAGCIPCFASLKWFQAFALPCQ